ncbi:hypothetical protein BDV97DRAFT_399067 [Delphinella strobiligena]|nr:hypothetical protein BDV97DRAFT_399067 [Delphinella strobiligena]
MTESTPWRGILPVPPMPPKTDPDYEEKKRERTRVMKKNSKHRRQDRKHEDFLQAKEEAAGDQGKLQDWKNKRNRETRERKENWGRGRGGVEEQPQTVFETEERAAAEEKRQIDDILAKAQIYRRVMARHGDAGADDVDALSRRLEGFSVN